MSTPYFNAGLARVLILVLLLGMPAVGSAAAGDEWVAVSWHDVRPDVNGRLDPDRFAVSTWTLAEQFEWLKAEGWQPISVDTLIAAHRGRARLPEKAVLLTFDDGLASVYDHVFPLLEAYDFPAVVAVVTGWQERIASGGTIEYQGRRWGPQGLASWAELKEMADSGLVSLASHSHDMHRGVTANPQGNRQPAAATLRYDPATGRYERPAQYRARVRADLARSVALIEQRTGHRPRTMIWPYGAFNEQTEAIARELGMPVSLGLSTGVNTTDRLSGLRRFLVTGNPPLDEFARNLPQTPDRNIRRVAQVDLDYVYDPDPDQQRRNLDRLLDRIKALDLTAVYLQAYADPDGDGTASALYFPNRHLPVRADLFNRVAWQLRTRAEVDVYAWLPVLAFDLPDPWRARSLAVRRRTEDGPVAANRDYRRLSPFLPEARRFIGDIYTDLARHADVAGLLFHDDAYLAADEDASACRPEASWPGTGASIADCGLSPAQKTRALVDFTGWLTERVRAWRPAVRTARNLYAPVVMDPEAGRARFSQSLPAFLAAYDTTALMAMPWLEGAGDPGAWLADLVDRVASVPGGLGGVLFELQGRDWRRGAWLDGETLRAQMHRLTRAGAVNLGWYPDDFIHDRPAFEPLFQGVSTRTFPYRRR